jgi:hypothetical protein
MGSDRSHHRRPSFIAAIALISTAPRARAHGESLTSWYASSRSAASMMLNPASGALEFAYGPCDMDGVPSHAVSVVGSLLRLFWMLVRVTALMNRPFAAFALPLPFRSLRLSPTDARSSRASVRPWPSGPRRVASLEPGCAR